MRIICAQQRSMDPKLEYQETPVLTQNTRMRHLITRVNGTNAAYVYAESSAYAFTVTP